MKYFEKNRGNMTNKNSDPGVSNFPHYSIGEIMALLNLDESSVRKLIIKAGIDIDKMKKDPSETIRYEDFRLLWLSLANRREGRLLARLLIEERENWFTRWGRKGR